MTSKRPTLLPAFPTSTATPPDNGLTSTLFKHQLRRQCDGRTPCSKCVIRNEPCDYKAKASVTKHDLRAEVETLKLESLNNRVVLHALLHDKHDAIVQRLRAGEPIDAIAKSLAAEDVDDDEESRECVRQEEHSTPIPFTSVEHASPLGPQDVVDIGRPIVDISNQFEAGHVAPSIFAAGGGIEVPRRLSIPVDSPATSRFPFSTQPATNRRHSLGAYAHMERPSVDGGSQWTRATSNMQLVDHLFGLFFSWEFPPFTMVSEELFMRDYFEGGRQFCSPALVNAIACVATRYLEPSGEISSDDVHLLGEQFFHESKGLLIVEGQIPNLPSIQAFAILAMREMACGRELGAQELCVQAVRLSSALDIESLGVQGRLADCLTVRSIAFSGVLSLARVVRLITNQLSPAFSYHPANTPLVSDFPGSRGVSWAIQIEQRLAEIGSKLPERTELKAGDMLSSFIFEQTDYAYSFLYRDGGSSSQIATEQLPMVYRASIQSYETLTNFLKVQGDSSPYTLFAHIYFHFCLLAIFRPLAHHDLEVAGVSPRTICAEATQAILDLTQSYADLFSLRRTPCFVPYFVFAAGLTRIVLEGDSRRANSSSVSPRMSSGLATGSIEGTSPFDPGGLYEGGDSSMSGTYCGQSPVTPPSTAMSTSASTGSASLALWSPESEEDCGSTQAVLQLEEMSVGHLGAAQAGRVLRDYDLHQQDYR